MTNPLLGWAHPLVRDWFLNRFGSPTEPQQQGWPPILAKKTTLIAAPTGSGKTLAAFLACIDHLVRQALCGELTNHIQVVYVSPLKALSNDVQKNLMAPLAELSALAQQQGLPLIDIRVGVRTGDTLARERQAMLKNPPHILVTTPETLYILLTAEKSRALLTNVGTVIVDEIHALAGDKRGAHLALSLERLQALTLKPLVRIGLSATQKPLEKVADFLTGHHRAPPVIINIGHIRPLDLAVEIPISELCAVASHEMWDQIYDRLAQLAQQNRSTLVFVNTRRLAERVAHHLRQRLGAAQVAAHHGSLSKPLRLAAETKLKNGELTVLVATASLELGIDIGAVDLVCQLGSPRAIGVALQRIGRAGHWRGAIPKGRIFATTREELFECAALVYAMRSGDLDQLRIPDQPMDILAQQMVAICAAGEWREDDLFHLVCRAYHYAHLSRSQFDALLDMLADGIAGSRGRYGAYLFRDRVNGIVRARRGSRLTALTSGGAIPENGLFTVVCESDGAIVGTLDEDFVVESNRGDIILLGTTSWQITRIDSSGRVMVADAHGAPPSVPFWRGEAPARTPELSLQLTHLREKLTAQLASSGPGGAQNPLEVGAAQDWLLTECGLCPAAAQQMIEYLLRGRSVLTAVPTQTTVIAERFFDEAGGMQLIIHAPFGARINKAWALALRKRFCRSFNFELQAVATDNGLNISLAEQHSFPLSEVFQFLNPQSVKAVLVQAVLQSPLFAARWRWDAMRALALVRFRNGKKVPPRILRILADDLLAAVFPDAAACQDNLGGRDIDLPDHPLIDEVIKDVLTEALDIDGFIAVLQGIYSGVIRCIAVDTPLPSLFAHEILHANPYAFLDDAPLEERRSRAVELRRVLPDAVLKDTGRLDPLAIQQVQEQAWPDIRDADELHDALQTLIAFPEDQNFFQYFTALNTSRRASVTEIMGRRFWWATERGAVFSAIYCQDSKHPDFFEALVKMIRGWLLHSGPITAMELSQRLAVAVVDIDQALLKLEGTGLILRGHFRSEFADFTEWCERRWLARIHQLTLRRLRQDIVPLPMGRFLHWLLAWQHLAPGTQLRGEVGLLAVIQQLQGLEFPAHLWERQILAKRLVDYDPQILDRCCLTGIVGWGRLSPHPAEKHSGRVMPTRAALMTFFMREDAWITAHHRSSQAADIVGLSHTAKKVRDYLQQKGASFFGDIARGVGHLPAEVEAGLWELVAVGLVTADGFDNWRALVSRRRLARHGTARWSLLVREEPGEIELNHEAWCRVLLKRYGVVFRDLLILETRAPAWRELLMTFRRLEDRGEVRGGRFIQGAQGEHFALLEVVESLRDCRYNNLPASMIDLASVDPFLCVLFRQFQAVLT